MQKYGTIDANGRLLQSDEQTEGYKPIERPETPSFDQATQFLSESYTEEGGAIVVTYTVNELQADESPADPGEGDGAGDFVEGEPWQDQAVKKAEEDLLLKNQMQATNQYIDFLEEVIVEMADKVY